MKNSDLIEKIKNLPTECGIYMFKSAEGDILYVGKATNLKTRVRSYFNGTDSRGERIFSMIEQTAEIKTKKTDSVLEALILESNLIKQYRPKYNIREKDDKSFSYFVITKEEFPRIVIMRKTDLDLLERNEKKGKFKDIVPNKIYGPYVSKRNMEIVLKILRRIFPFHSMRVKTEKGCLDFQIGQCPGPYAGAISKQEYKKNIRGIRMVLEGKKKRLLTTLKKEMESASKNEQFEKAAQLRNKIFALTHIRDTALMSRDEFGVAPLPEDSIRIEAYDISNITGQYAVGSMVVFVNGKPDKSQYRKFKIKWIEGPNDVAMMQEVLFRRFRNDWPKPNIILLDGGQGHFNMAQKLFKELNLHIPIAAIAKGPSRKKIEICSAIPRSEKVLHGILQDRNLIKYIMDEAHRFAITYHKSLRSKNWE